MSVRRPYSRDKLAGQVEEILAPVVVATAGTLSGTVLIRKLDEALELIEEAEKGWLKTIELLEEGDPETPTDGG